MLRVQPTAYIRRSARSRTDPGDISREFQIEKVRELAGPDGASLRIIDADWGRSAATDKTNQRLAFLALLEEIERGEVSALYAYSTDRLARSVEWAARLLNVCRRAGVVIVTSEGRFEPDNAMTDQMFYFQAVQNEGYSRQATAKRNDSVRRQRQHTDKLGPKFYGELPGESIGAVLAAFDECGSAHRTAVLLNERGIPTRRGGPWSHGAVRQILVREGRVPKLGVRGAKPRAPFAFYRLLRCHCGRTMTGVRHGRIRGGDRPRPIILYRCINGSTDPAHGTKSIAESKLLGWAKLEAARLALPGDELEIAERGEQERIRLEAKRDLILDAYFDGAIDKPARDARLAEVDAAIARVDAEAVVVDLPSVEWSAPPEALNGALSALWERIDLGPDLRPVSAVWRVPEWRRED